MATRRERVIKSDGSDLRPQVGYTEREWAGVHAQKARLAKRAERGHDWDGKEVAEQGWPLAKSLLREGNEALLRVAVKYRVLYETAKGDPLLGGGGSPMASGMAIDQRTHVNSNGNIAYKGVRKVAGAPQEKSPTMKVEPVENKETGVQYNTVKIPKKWNGDRAVNDKLDAERLLSQVQEALGHLQEPLEMSVVDGATYQEVGNYLREAQRSQAIAAGRTVVHLGLVTVRDALHNLE